MATKRKIKKPRTLNRGFDTLAWIHNGHVMVVGGGYMSAYDMKRLTRWLNQAVAWTQQERRRPKR